MTKILDPYTAHILEQLKGQDLYTKPRVDYDEFRNNWLALFNYNTKDNMAPLGEWIQAKCRGNPFLAVEVVKGGSIIPDPLYDGQTTIDGGKVMFVVPPILNNNIEVKLKSGKNISRVSTQGAALGQRLAAAGNNYFEKNIVQDLVIEVEDATRLSRQMDEIFAHFGIKRKNSVQVSTKAPNVTEDNPALRTSNDDLDFNF